MKYGKIGRQRSMRVTVPQLWGGLNLQDGLSQVNDNQLTDCRNMWYRDGVLCTRPGCNLLVAEISGKAYTAQQVVNEREALLIGTHNDSSNLYFTARGFDRDGSDFLGMGVYSGTLPTDGTALSALGFRAQKNDEDDWQFFLSGGDIVGAKVGGAPAPAQPYIPTVLINGWGLESAEEAGSGVTGHIYEDYNMLTRAFKCQFTTDGKSSTFCLPQQNLAVGEDGNTWAVVELTVTDGEGSRTVKATIPMHNTVNYPGLGSLTLSAKEAGVEGDGTVTVNVRLDADAGRISFTDKNDEPFSFPRVINNNLTVTAWRGQEYDAQRLEVCRMTQCVWYGGDSSGLSAGTRLFVTGNPAKPNLIRWSGVNDPLYFPELNYAYIGDNSQAVTGFGKQGELLLLFKERELYATQYVAGDEEDYAYAMNNGVPVDTYMARFPVTPLHSTVGCDCPNSIRLVNNRLVWADSTGRVYMLVSGNAYSERNVRDLSPNIRPLLCKHEKAELKAAVAGELEGYYLLLVGRTMYLLDSQTSAYHSFSYYSDEEKAQRALPWYVWTLPEKYTYKGMVSDGSGVTLYANDDSGTGYVLYMADAHTPGFDSEGDDGQPISCYFVTKLFDFDRPDVRKAVEQVYLTVADRGEGEIRVSYVTDRDTLKFTDSGLSSVEEEGYILRTYGEAGPREPGHLRSVRLTPNLHRVRAFALRCDSEGTMAVEGITVKVKQQGVVR